MNSVKQTFIADNQRIQGIDALRGLAVFFVFVFHCFLELHHDDGPIAKIYSGQFNHLFPHHLGVLGVQLFFVISGFCIHLSSLKWAKNHPTATKIELWSAYAQRRCWRILPLYLLVLISLWLIDFSQQLNEYSYFDLFIHMSMLQSLVPGQKNLINPSFWSISVEVQLYILYPLLWYTILKRRSTQVIILFIMLCFVWKFIATVFWPFQWWINLPWRWGFEFLLGVAAAMTLERRWPGGWMLLIMSLAVSTLMLCFRSVTETDVLSPLLFALIVGWAARGKFPFAAQLAALGAISYEFYLVHQPVLMVINKLFGLEFINGLRTSQFLTACGLSFILCLIISRVMKRLTYSSLIYFNRSLTT